jgi:MSHA pilin protein MshA
MKRNAGFTLIELVIVIIVLGILAATAVPKFINLQDDAKEAAMKGLEGALHSGANIVYSKSAIDGTEGLENKSVIDAGTTIQTNYGYPKASKEGIRAAIEIGGFDSKAPGTVTVPASLIFWNGNASTTNDTCITYAEASSAARYTVEEKKCAF